MTRMHRPIGRLVALGASAVVAVACSGSSKQAAPTTIVITVPSTVASPATSTATTTAATVAPTASTAPTTTVAATTTSAAPTPEQAVRAAWRGWIAAGEACTVDPKGCDRATLAQFMETGPLAKKVEATDELIKKGWRLTLGPGPVEERYRVEKVTMRDAEADIQFCQYDAGVVADPGAGPNGEDVIINDAKGSNRSVVTFHRGADLRWRLAVVVRQDHELGDVLWNSCVAG